MGIICDHLIGTVDEGKQEEIESLVCEETSTKKRILEGQVAIITGSGQGFVTNNLSKQESEKQLHISLPKKEQKLW